MYVKRGKDETRKTEVPGKIRSLPKSTPVVSVALIWVTQKYIAKLKIISNGS